MTTVREATWDVLRDLGLTTVFGNPGSTEIPFLRDLPADFDYVLALHEGSAVAMADVYAQAAGRPALVNLHTSSGVGNAMGSLTNAQANNSPLVVTAGQQVRAMLQLDPLLANKDATTLPKPLVKHAAEPARAQDIPAALAHATHVATAAPPGPVFVSMPMDDLDAEADPAVLPPRGGRRVWGRPVADRVALARVAERLAAAERPAYVAGAEADTDEGFRAGVALAERLGMAVYQAPFTPRCGFPTDHPAFRGGLPSAIRPLAEKLAGHDLVLVAGAPVFRYYPYVPGPFLPDGTDLVQLTGDPDAAARAPVGEALVGDVGEALSRLVELTAGPARRESQASTVHSGQSGEAAGSDSSEGAGDSEGSDDGMLTTDDVVEVLARVFPADGVIVTDSGNAMEPLTEHVALPRPGSLYFCGAGTIGFAIPGGVGAQMATPDRPVLALTGDGSAQYCIQALWTAAQRTVPVTVLILDNQEYGILKGFGQFLGAEKIPGLDLGGLDYTAIAAGYHVDAEVARTAGELGDALAKAFEARDRPRVVIVPVQPGVSVL
jgi:benzoylformate decarboxylase